MAKVNKVKLSKQYDGKTFKGYRRFINGRMFTLGKDENIARLKAGALENAGHALKSQGRRWTDEIIRQAIALALGQPYQFAENHAEPLDGHKATTTPIVPQATSLHEARGLTVHPAIDRYVLYLDQRLADKEIGPEQRISLARRLAALRFAFADQSTLNFYDLPDDKQMLVEQKPLFVCRPPLKNMPIFKVGEQELKRFKSLLASRPVSRRTGKPIKVQTVKNNLQAAGFFFGWAKKNAKLWPGFEDWSELFQFGKNQIRNMKTAAEKTKEGGKKDHMTLDDLKCYWQGAIDRMKTFEGLAFWCAWTQMEIATFRKAEFYRDENGEAFIDKSRSKTGEVGNWWIPEPIAKLVERFMAETPDDPAVNPDGLAFLTEENQPLVHIGDSRSDLIANYLWKPIQWYSQNFRGRSHSFKWFRKTMPDMIGQMTRNKFIAKAALAQRVNDVADINYINPLTDAFVAAAKQLWQETMQFIHVIKDQKQMTPVDYEQANKAKQIVSTFLKTKHKPKVENPEVPRGGSMN